MEWQGLSHPPRDFEVGYGVPVEEDTGALSPNQVRLACKGLGLVVGGAAL